jgi:hypothetical protein
VSARIVRLGIRVRAEQAETALADLLPLLGQGAEEVDHGGTIEYAVYLPEGELPPPDAIRRLGGDAVLGTVTEPVGARSSRAPDDLIGIGGNANGFERGESKGPGAPDTPISQSTRV